MNSFMKQVLILLFFLNVLSMHCFADTFVDLQQLLTRGSAMIDLKPNESARVILHNLVNNVRYSCSVKGNGTLVRVDVNLSAWQGVTAKKNGRNFFQISTLNQNSSLYQVILMILNNKAELQQVEINCRAENLLQLKIQDLADDLSYLETRMLGAPKEDLEHLYQSAKEKYEVLKADMTDDRLDFNGRLKGIKLFLKNEDPKELDRKFEAIHRAITTIEDKPIKSSEDVGVAYNECDSVKEKIDKLKSSYKKIPFFLHIIKGFEERIEAYETYLAQRLQEFTEIDDDTMFLPSSSNGFHASSSAGSIVVDEVAGFCEYVANMLRDMEKAMQNHRDVLLLQRILGDLKSFIHKTQLMMSTHKVGSKQHTQLQTTKQLLDSAFDHYYSLNSGLPNENGKKPPTASVSFNDKSGASSSAVAFNPSKELEYLIQESKRVLADKFAMDRHQLLLNLIKDVELLFIKITREGLSGHPAINSLIIELKTILLEMQTATTGTNGFVL